MDMDIIYNISDLKKNTRISNSKICQRSELVQCRQIADSARADFYWIPYCYSKYQKCVFSEIERARLADKFSSWKLLYFFSAQKCYK